MLTNQELWDARDKLRAVIEIIEEVRAAYLGAGYAEGARLLNDAVNLVGDEIAALDKAIAGGQP